MREYRRCTLCPRKCGVNRLAGERGFCGEGAHLRLASALLHWGEEPPLTGEGGSGAIFVTGCGLGCAFCQNRQISGKAALGREVDAAEFAAICRALQEAGAENLNIVTGSHAAPSLAEGLSLARDTGCTLPVVWNSSAYESEAALERLSALVDLWLPDLKTLSAALGERFFNAGDYGEAAAAAILLMLGTGKPVIIRHLVLPGFLESTREVLRWFARHAKGRASLSLMTQYTPLGERTPGRYLDAGEYEAAQEMLSEFGLEDGYYQELTPDSSWLPDFERTSPFSSDLAKPVWHWKTGLLR